MGSSCRNCALSGAERTADEPEDRQAFPGDGQIEWQVVPDVLPQASFSGRAADIPVPAGVKEIADTGDKQAARMFPEIPPLRREAFLLLPAPAPYFMPLPVEFLQRGHVAVTLLHGRDGLFSPHLPPPLHPEQSRQSGSRWQAGYFSSCTGR